MSAHVTEHKHGGLGELPATAICGNDITPSCLYVSALAITPAGKFARLSLLIVAAVRQPSGEWDIPLKLMFIGAPGDHFMYGLAELGGVRLIV
jgi:hypothetical protein